MIKLNLDTLGIIFPNSYDEMVPDLVNVRLMGSIPFASRYRMIDFMLSSMVTCGIDNISVLVKNNYFSLMDHLGSGREWDLTRKNGGLNIIPPFAEQAGKLYTSRVEALASILAFLREQKEKYVVLSDANIATHFDFRAFLKEHIESGADVTIAYKEEPLPQGFKDDVSNSEGYYYSFILDEEQKFVKRIFVNPKADGVHNLSMNIYCMEREFLIDQINMASVRGLIHYDRDVLAPRLDTLKVRAYKYEGYTARISSMKSYFDENMKLLDDKNLDALFAGHQTYTKIRDDNPTRYIAGAKVKNTMAADGCIIEGEVENCVLFRGVKIKKGTKVKNCILMQDTVVEEGTSLEYVISDKNAKISANKELKGTDTFPVYISKGQKV